MAKRPTKADRAALHALVAKYGKYAVTKMIEAAPVNEPGRPPHHIYNAAAVWIHVQYRLADGLAADIDEACEQIAADLKKYIAGRTQKTGTLRGLYYRGRRVRDADHVLSARMDSELNNLRSARKGQVTFPILLRKVAGGLETPILDLSGRGGRK